MPIGLDATAVKQMLNGLCKFPDVFLNLYGEDGTTLQGRVKLPNVSVLANMDGVDGSYTFNAGYCDVNWADGALDALTRYPVSVVVSEGTSEATLFYGDL